MNSIKAANQVLQRTSEYLNSGLVSSQPAWYKALAYHPPKHAFNKTVRQDILENVKNEEISAISEINDKLSNGYYITRIKSLPKEKVTKLLRSQKLHYIEDDLRLLFYKQHPWELADAKNMVENEYNLANVNCDWSHLRQFNKKLDGESVVQRTLYLMDNENKPLLQAYEESKFEYYRLKIQDETEMNISREESEMFGAIYPSTYIEDGFAKESEVLEKWSSDAIKQNEILSAKSNNNNSSSTASSNTAQPQTQTRATRSEDQIFDSLT